MKSNHHHLHIGKSAYERRASTTKASKLNSASCRIRKFCRTLMRQHRYQLVQNRLHVSSELPSLSSKLPYTLTLTAATCQNICSIEPLSYKIKSNANYLHCQPSRPSLQFNQLQCLNKTNLSRKTKTI